MKKAKQSDKKLIVDLLIESFEDNQSVNYIIKQDKKRTLRIRALMDYSFEVCSLFGNVWLSDDNNACGLILYPQKKKTTFKSIWLNIKLIFQSIGIGGIIRAMKRETLITKKQPQINMAYLWFIGVNPIYQHSGIGSKLLREIIVENEKHHLPVVLETSTIENLPWYTQFGFHIYDELELSYKLFFLKYDPIK